MIRLILFILWIYFVSGSMRNGQAYNLTSMDPAEKKQKAMAIKPLNLNLTVKRTEKVKPPFQSAFISISVSAVFLNVIPVPASALESSATTSDAPNAAILKGKVVEIGTTLNDVRDARLSVSRVRKATADLYDEVTRQEVSLTYNPNLIGTTVIMTPAPTVSGVYLPARKKWVDVAMSEIGPIIHLFKEDVDAALESDRRTDVSDASRKLLSSLRDSAFSLVKDAFTNYKELQTLTAAEQFDNRAIAGATSALDKKMKELDRVLKRALSLLEKEARSAAKSRR